MLASHYKLSVAETIQICSSMNTSTPQLVPNRLLLICRKSLRYLYTTFQPEESQSSSCTLKTEHDEVWLLVVMVVLKAEAGQI